MSYTLSQLFGAAASFDSASGVVSCDLDDMASATGITKATATPNQIASTLLYFMAQTLISNPILAANIEATQAETQPVVRNGVQKRRIDLTFRLYFPYTFSPIDTDGI